MLLYSLLVLITLYLLLAFGIYVYRRFIAIRQSLKQNVDSLRTCIVLGSGGHTGEMIPLLNSLDHQRYSCVIVGFFVKEFNLYAVPATMLWPILIR